MQPPSPNGLPPQPPYDRSGFPPDGSGPLQPPGGDGASGPDRSHRPSEPGAPARRGYGGYGYGAGDGYGPFLRATHQARVSEFLATLHRYELTLRKHWWILVLSLVAALAPTSWHIYTTPPSYRSVGKLWMSGKLNLKEGQLYSEELGTFMGTQIALLNSSTIYDRASRRLLETHPEWAEASTNTAALTGPEFTLKTVNAPRTSIIELEALGLNPDAVRLFLDLIMEEYQAYRKEMRTESTDVTLASITDQVTSLEKELRAKQELMHNFMASNNVVLLQEQGSSAGAYVAQLNRQLANLRTESQLLDLLTPEQLTRAATKTRLNGDIPLASDASARDLTMSLSGPQADFFKANQQIELLRAQREELAAFLRPTHPKIIKFDEDIVRQQQVIDVFRRQSLDQMQNRREALEIQIDALNKSIAEWEAKAIDASRKTAEYDRLRQDAQRTQGLYDRLLGAIQSVDVNRTLDQEVVRVMEKASPAKQVREVKRLLAMGSIAGLGLGLGLLTLLNRFDDRFTSISELRNHLSEPVVGQIPALRLSTAHPTVDLIQSNDERHVFAESFRNIRSWFLFSFRDQSKTKVRTVLVTSSVPSEGKTTIAANLAATLALSGSRVLLVDCDLRRASLHKYFRVANEPGASEVLEQEARVEEAIIHTKTPNLDLLPAGEPGVNPGELFLAPSMDLLLARLREKYDYILFDSAPIMATDDTSNLAPKLDGLLFVVRADYTSARQARESLALLRQRQVNVLGVIFNRALASRNRERYYRYDDYYYAKKKQGAGSKSQKTEVRGQGTEVRGQGTEVRGQRSEVSG